MRSGLARERGSVLVEFAAVVLVLLTIMFGIMDFSRALYIYHFISEAAREASRYAMVRGSTWSAGCVATTTYSCKATAANVTSYVQSITPMGISSAWVTSGCPSATNPCVNTTWLTTTPSGTACAADSPGCRVSVQVTYPLKYILTPLFLPKSTQTLQSTSVMVISQ
jgi:Flp pilus assembly protein TadG